MIYAEDVECVVDTEYRKCQRKRPDLFGIDVGGGSAFVGNRMFGGCPPSERGTPKTVGMSKVTREGAACPRNTISSRYVWNIGDVLTVKRRGGTLGSSILFAHRQP
jgi:hypothetical protein